MIKFIETKFSYDEGLMNVMARSGSLKTVTKLISIDKIVYLKPWEGENLHKGRTGVEIHLTDGSKHIDERTYQEFMNLLTQLNMIY